MWVNIKYVSLIDSDLKLYKSSYRDIWFVMLPSLMITESTPLLQKPFNMKAQLHLLNKTVSSQVIS